MAATLSNTPHMSNFCDISEKRLYYNRNTQRFLCRLWDMIETKFSKVMYLALVVAITAGQARESELHNYMLQFD